MANFLPVAPYGVRTAYVGLSGPLFYDYRNPARRVDADLASSPNPLLVAPISLMLLYDEIWFLSRSLCPDNLRDCAFVRFVDESGALDDLDPDDVENWLALNSSELERTACKIMREEFFDRYSAVLRDTGIGWDNACDNHTHALRIGPLTTSANSASFRSLLLDIYILKYVERPYVDLIANPFLEKCLSRNVFPAGKLSFSERLVGPRLLNWQTPFGPYRGEIDALRAHRYLEDYRAWVGRLDVGGFDAKEAAERQEAVEREIYAAMKKALLEKLDDSLLVKNSAVLLGKAALDLATAGISGYVLDSAEALKKHVESKSSRWQGFLLDLESGRPA